MGKEWSMAVKKIFSKKYSNGRGKLADAMKDPETKIVHAELLGKKPSKSMTKGKTLKNKKLGGQPNKESDPSLSPSPLPKAEDEGVADPEDDAYPESEVVDEAVDQTETEAVAQTETEAVAHTETEAVAQTGAQTGATDKRGGKQKSTRGGKKSKKSKKNSSKKERSKSFRKKNCGW